MTASLLLFTATVVRSEALAQPYGEQFSHLIKVRNRDPLAHNFTSSRHSMNPAYFGSVKLPVDLDPNHLPDACSNFAEECAMEAAGRFEAAFAGYETRLSTCGLAGWRKVGNLGSGNVVTTMVSDAHALVGFIVGILSPVVYARISTFLCPRLWGFIK